LRKLLVLGIALALVLAACGGDDDSGGSSAPVKLSGKVTNKGTTTVSGTELKLEADDLYFKPTFVNAKPGTKLKIEIENEGKNTHTFTIDAASVDEEIAPGKSADVEVTVPSSGNLNFYCRFHRGSGMQGALIAKS